MVRHVSRDGLRHDDPVEPSELDALRAACARHPALRVLVLLGSRARGDAHPRSDWDLGYLSDAGLDVGALVADLTSALGTDDVDLVDLRRASALLRRDAGADGVLVHERTPGSFVDFRVEVATFWCDVEPVLRETHADVLRSVAG